MGKTYSCTLAGCDKIFTKAYELKKHKVAHKDPDSLFYCSKCDFTTLQKKNLGIHFALHTGEKIYQCPGTIDVESSSESPSREERCKYRTNDPAALTKHRKKVHGYIPPPNRSRPLKTASTSPRKPRQKQDGKASRRPRRSPRSAPASRLKASRLPRMANSSSGRAGDKSVSSELPEDSPPLLWQGDMDGFEQWMDANSPDQSGYESSVSSSETLVAPEEDMDLGSLYDPSLYSEWMAKYEMGYSMFKETGMKYQPEPVREVSPLESTSIDTQTSRGACLCPEWMVEAGIDGWDQSVLEAHREFYVLGA